MRRFLLTAGVCTFIVAVLTVVSVFHFENRELLYTALSIFLFLTGSFILKFIAPKMSRKRFFKFQFIKNSDFKLVIHMTVLVISGGFLLNLLMITLLELFGNTVPSNAFSQFNTANIWISLFTVAFIPAVFEELFFRGAVLSSLSADKTIMAVFVSSLFFSLVHGSLYYFLSNFFAGIVFSVIIYLTGSIFASITAHLFNNILSYILFVYSSRLMTVGFDNFVVWILVLIFLVALYNTIGAIAKKYKEELKLDRPLINEGELIWEKRKGKE